MNVPHMCLFFYFINDLYKCDFFPLIKCRQQYNKKMRFNILKQLANEIENLLELILKNG
jgi:hypothetical protein